MSIDKKLDFSTAASYLLTALFLLLVLLKGLLGALFAGLLMFSLIHLMVPFLGRKISDRRARMIAAAAIGIILIAALGWMIWGAITFLRADANSLTKLFKKMADIIDGSRGQIPPWIEQRLPVDPDALRETMTGWLREHAADAKALGTEAGKTVTRILIGMIIGVLVSVRDTVSPHARRPFADALLQRASHLSAAFRNIVFAQVWISGINTIITALFIFVVLPLAGVSLPFSKTMVAITFVAGLFPVVGNLISNTILVVVALSHSLQTALFSLLFMVLLHKLEYFLNARIIGSHINARAWELLMAMLVAESVFGLTGVIAAPVFYAYAKKELTARGLI